MKRLSLVGLTWCMLVACGGGGGGSSSPVASGAAPTVGATPSTPVTSGSGGQTASGQTSDLIRGTITGFGSIYIDGKRFDTSDASFSKDDSAASQDDLRIGMVVEVRGDLASGVANVVSFEEDIKGPLDSVDVQAERLVALGQTVLITPSTVFDEGLALDSLIQGDVLEISGFRGQNDELEASFIERKTTSDVNAYKVIGQIRNLDSQNQTFVIGGLAIDYSVAQLEDGLSLSDGVTVEVKDEQLAYSPGDMTLIATKVEPAGLGDATSGSGDSADDSDIIAISNVQIEGLVSNTDGENQFELAGTQIVITTSTQFLYGDVQSIALGTKLQVEGQLNEDGSVTATKIKFARNSARLHGIVEVVDFQAQELSILGIRIDVASVTSLEDDRDDVEGFGIDDIAAGDFLEVRGNSVGELIIANQIEREESDDTRLRGPVMDSDLAAGTVQLFGLTLQTSGATQFEGLDDQILSREAFFEALANGQTLVEAKWDGTVTDSSVAVKELSLED